MKDIILVDTREQKPIFKVNNKTIIKQCLSEGDYTTSKLYKIAHIERKSGQDLYGSIIGNHIRFRNELLRAQNKNIKLAIFVECTKNQFIYKKFSYGSNLKTPSNTLDSIINTISSKYNVNFVFCKNRSDFKTQVLLWFENELRKINHSNINNLNC